MTVQWGDVATWVGGVSTAAALGFAGVQVKLLRNDARRLRRVALDGVAVTWRVLDAPACAEPDGTSAATYRFKAHNPGDLPITHVDVRMQVPIQVQRIHTDG